MSRLPRLAEGKSRLDAVQQFKHSFKDAIYKRKFV